MALSASASRWRAELEETELAWLELAE